MKSDIVTLNNIVAYCDEIISDMEFYGMDEDVFLDNNRFQRSSSFSLFQIGENVKRLSDEIRKKYDDVEWSDIAGLRDVIGHGYNDIRLHSLWITISTEVPLLKSRCIEILNELK